MTENGQMLRKSQKLWKLFLTMLYISAFTFGGGFVIVTLMKRKLVDELHWIDEEEMLDITAIAQSSPGPIAVNAAIMAGWHIGGFAGMLAGVLGTVIPPVLILSVISFFYSAFASNRVVALVLKGMQAGVAAVIFDVVLNMGAGIVRQKKWVYNLIMLGAFIAVMFFSVNVIYVILAAALIGVLSAWIGGKRGDAK